MNYIRQQTEKPNYCIENEKDETQAQNVNTKKKKRTVNENKK